MDSLWTTRPHDIAAATGLINAGKGRPRPADSAKRAVPDVVEQASIDSFPASDPPAWISGFGIPDRLITRNN